MSRSYTQREGQIKQVLMIILIVASFVVAFIIQGSTQFLFTSNRIVAVTMTVIMVLLPPFGFGIVAPTSPAGMLLMRIRMRTPGYIVLAASILFVIGYSFVLQYSWWLTGDNVAKASGYAMAQAIIGVIGSCVVPGVFLVWLPMDQIVAELRQAHQVKRYELQTQAEKAVLRHTLMHATTISLKPLEDRTPDERRFLADSLVTFVEGIDRTLNEMTQGVGAVANVKILRTPLLDNPDIAAALDATEEHFGGSQGRVLPDQRGKTGQDTPRLTAPASGSGNASGAQGPNRTQAPQPQQNGGKGDQRNNGQRPTGDQRSSGPGNDTRGQQQRPGQHGKDGRDGQRSNGPDQRGGGGERGGGSNRPITPPPAKPAAQPTPPAKPAAAPTPPVTQLELEAAEEEGAEEE